MMWWSIFWSSGHLSYDVVEYLLVFWWLAACKNGVGTLLISCTRVGGCGIGKNGVVAQRMVYCWLTVLATRVVWTGGGETTGLPSGSNSGSS